MRIDDEAFFELSDVAPNRKPLSIDDGIRIAFENIVHSFGVFKTFPEVHFFIVYASKGDFFDARAILKYIASVWVNDQHLQASIVAELFYQELRMALHASNLVWEDAICAEYDLYCIHFYFYFNNVFIPSSILTSGCQSM